MLCGHAFTDNEEELDSDVAAEKSKLFTTNANVVLQNYELVLM